MLDTYVLDAMIADSLFLTGDGPFGEALGELKVRLVAAPFSPSKTLAFGDLTYATFTGGAAKDTATGLPQVQVYDSPSKRWGIMLAEPAGGFNWVCTAAPDSPETIYGVVVYLPNGGSPVLYFSELLPGGPKVIENIGDFISIASLIGFLPSDLFPELPPTD
jgi:hypothetical protein